MLFQAAKASRSALDKLVAREVPVSWFGLASQVGNVPCLLALAGTHHGMHIAQHRPSVCLMKVRE